MMEFLTHLFAFIAGGGLASWAMCAMIAGAEEDKRMDDAIRTLEQRARDWQ